MEYKNTLQLPKTEFAMRANLAQKEPEILKFWNEMHLYEYIKERRKGQPKKVLHDGPPYANGNIHIGTALNKILKDIVVKYWTMKGYDSPYKPGWDTHGLPIEHKVSTELGEKRKSMDKLQIRKACEKYALRFAELQSKEFQRLGVRGDWSNPYLTLKPEYEEKVLQIFKTLVKNKNVYRSKKVVHWCYSCETALAEAEIEYEDEVSDSIYVKFPVENQPKTFILIWTTTPWTLPANLAVALHPDFEYAFVEVECGDTATKNTEIWVLADKLVTPFFEKLKKQPGKILKKVKGRELEGTFALHPFLNRKSVVVLADYVDLDTGSGCVHTAPGHGEDDYNTGLKYGLDIFSPVNHEGRFTDEVPEYSGTFVFDSNPLIIKRLQETGALVYSEKFKHSYPHCWRCKKPVLFRATEQWFIRVDENSLRERVLSEIERVHWVPDWGKNRIRAMVESRPDWCISRQRAWGIPIPAFYCKSCGKTVISEHTLDYVIPIIRKEGTNAWYSKTAEELLPRGFQCPHCGGIDFKKEEDIMDVWIDSGSSFEAVLLADAVTKNSANPEFSFPADVYLEGSDQHRGWFQSSIFLSVAKHNQAPFKEVITHGFICDGKGYKMSKSIGNVIFPQEIYEKYGAEVLRLWVASSDYRNDINISMDIILQQVDVYKKIRNTIRFILGNLYDFDPEKNRVEYQKLSSFDRWALSRLQQLILNVDQSYENYEFYKGIQMINRYIISDLSAVYLDILKDRLYVEGQDSASRRGSQTVFWEILKTLTLLLAPVLTFTSEEIYTFFPKAERKEKTIQAESWPQPQKEYIQKSLDKKWEELLAVREKVNIALESVRTTGEIGHSLDAKVLISAKDTDLYSLLQEERGFLSDFFIVSACEVIRDQNQSDMIKIQIVHADGKKCQRCWKYDTETGKDGQFPDTCPRCGAVLKNA